MKAFLVGAVLASLWFHPVAGFCGGDLDGFVRDLNVQARTDLHGFTARVSATFGVPQAQVEVVLSKVRTPADAYMVFKVEQVARQPRETVLREYDAHPGKGWGVIAKSLGIKPGSREFHELKKGFADDGPGGGKGKGKGKGRGKGRDD